MFHHQIRKVRQMNSPGSNGKTLLDKIKLLLQNTAMDEKRREELLKAILGLARGITNGTNGDATLKLQKGFDEAFEGLPADKVTMLLSYRDGQPHIIVGNPDILQATSDNEK
jgi:hypothetical protein